ncbi:hypothetical protein AAVH_13532 [Aphelenchoides avenae]|nr:hypothetical protein AAVH_13532 [Aphelenchus avenae]
MRRLRSTGSFRWSRAPRYKWPVVIAAIVIVVLIVIGIVLAVVLSSRHLHPELLTIAYYNGPPENPKRINSDRIKRAAAPSNRDLLLSSVDAWSDDLKSGRMRIRLLSYSDNASPSATFLDDPTKIKDQIQMSYTNGKLGGDNPSQKSAVDTYAGLATEGTGKHSFMLYAPEKKAYM